MRGRWVYPLDPDCPGAREEVFDRIQSMREDPMTQHYGVDVSEFSDEWERKHQRKCDRCQEYGTANVDVDY
jgi:hypothetical protein